MERAALAKGQSCDDRIEKDFVGSEGEMVAVCMMVKPTGLDLLLEESLRFADFRPPAGVVSDSTREGRIVQ